MKKITSILLAVLLLCALCGTAMAVEPLPLVLPEESVINASEVLTAAEEPVQEIVEEASAAPEQIAEVPAQIEETVLEEAVSELPVMDEQSPAEIVSGMPTASVLSEGRLWIIIVIAVIAVGAAVWLIVKRELISESRE